MRLEDFSKQTLLESLSKIYISIFLFDLKKDELTPIQSNKFIDEWSKDQIGCQAKTNNVMKNITMPEHIETILNFVDCSTLDERMAGENNVSVVFKGKINGWCRARFIAVDYAEDGTLHHVLYTVECINEEKERENYLLYMAQTDFLTEISNRGYGEHEVTKLLEAGRQGAFGLFDVDQFKAINDLYGHMVGDEVLVNIGRCLKAIQGPEDIIMRLGGDEFAFYLVDVKNEAEIRERTVKLFAEVDRIKELMPIIGKGVSVSLGVVFWKEGMNFDALYTQADKGVYSSKRSKGSTLTLEG